MLGETLDYYKPTMGRRWHCILCMRGETLEAICIS